MIKGLVSDIEQTSIHDGYGLRTVVFLKGCPLNCAWCHNPECISFEKQTLFYPDKCIRCGKCSEGCYSGAKVVCGREYTPDEILAAVSRDKVYYGNDGGVTFSGGEPLAQRNFLSQCIDLCRNDGIGCAVETSLMYFDKEIFAGLDFVMADLKIWDNEIHQKYTGVGNERILRHFRMLNELDIPIIARTPVIPDIDQGVDKISGFLMDLKNVTRYELLPYHSLGNVKRAALGLEPDGFSLPEPDFIKEVNKYAFVR